MNKRGIAWRTACVLTSSMTSLCAANAADVMALSDDGSLRESFVSALSGIAFEAGEDNKQARLRWARNRGTDAFSATLSVPVDEKEGSRSLADLDGLAKALSFSGSYTKYFTAAFTAEAQKVQDDICARWNIQNTCDNDHLDQLDPPPQPSEVRAFKYAGMGQSWTPFFSLEAKVGRQKVDFFETATLAKSDDIELPYAVTAGFGGLTLHSVWFARAKLQKAVKEKDKVTYCTSAAVDPRAEDCSTLAFGAPALETSTVLSFEYRTFYKFVAISPMISYNTKTDQSGIDVPIYFMKDAAAQFTGGVRLGYKTKDDKDVTASIFITKPLSL